MQQQLAQVNVKDNKKGKEQKKKDDKKNAKKGKEEVAKVVNVLDWKVEERTKIFIKDKHIISCLKEQLSV